MPAERPRCDYGLCRAPAVERWEWPRTASGEARYCAYHARTMAAVAARYPRAYPSPEQRFPLRAEGANDAATT